MLVLWASFFLVLPFYWFKWYRLQTFKFKSKYWSKWNFVCRVCIHVWQRIDICTVGNGGWSIWSKACCSFGNYCSVSKLDIDWNGFVFLSLKISFWILIIASYLTSALCSTLSLALALVFGWQLPQDFFLGHWMGCLDQWRYHL